MGELLKLLLAQDVSVDEAAMLLELDATAVRRLVRLRWSTPVGRTLGASMA